MTQHLIDESYYPNLWRAVALEVWVADKRHWGNFTVVPRKRVLKWANEPVSRPNMDVPRGRDVSFSIEALDPVFFENADDMEEWMTVVYNMSDEYVPIPF